MAIQKVGIATECICDLPQSYLEEHHIGVLYFTVRTDSGEFTDTIEITPENIIDYMETGSGVPVSSPPSTETYAKLFREMLEAYDEAVFITTGAGASNSYREALKAVSDMGQDGRKITVFDSGHLSTGLGHVVIRASELAEAGALREEIIPALEKYTEKVSTSFVANNADYLCRNGRVSQNVKKLCDIFGIHPVLMMKNGGLSLKSVLIGNYEKACLRYVRQSLRKVKNIDKTRIFITHVGCGRKRIEKIKEEIRRRCEVKEIIVTKASATISSNCGPGTFGVMFVKEK